MAISIGPASREDHKAALEFLFGSIENYLASPELKHVQDRAQECQDLIDGINAFYNSTYESVSWLRIYTKLTILIGRKIVGKTLCKSLAHLKVCYLNQRGLPAKIIIRGIDEQFDQTIKPFMNIIEVVREDIANGSNAA